MRKAFRYDRGWRKGWLLVNIRNVIKMAKTGCSASSERLGSYSM